jgi:predicted SAM-dependent methyltransferase
MRRHLGQIDLETGEIIYKILTLGTGVCWLNECYRVLRLSVSLRSAR